MKLQEVQAHAILRGSKLSAKRVLVDSGAETGGVLTMKKVSVAIRLLGSSFFQEVTTGRKEKGLKTYDQTHFAAARRSEASWAMFEDAQEEDALEQLAQEEQDDPELAAYYSPYQDACRRLQENRKSKQVATFGKSRAAQAPEAARKTV